ncbi:hypothetical protein CI109_104164 [Kwoniella shandongensis]|uniref:Uncharacterized protein n=1 Tax=Kwoniella shandongensis TaxID=1734106 RepID=A0AAJ8MW63_9TREE
MPKGLLDLGNENLFRIAYFVHGDNVIPTPSFGSHWENYKSDIDPSASEAYRNLRRTCRNMVGLLELKGLHRRISNWQQIEDLMLDAPPDILKGIKRLEIDFGEQDLASHAVFPTWTTITTFLASLSNLEELIIKDLPICRHEHIGHTTESLRSPPYDFLPHLSALSIQVKCHDCTSLLPSLFILAAPQIRHLKMCYENGTFDTSTHVLRCTFADAAFKWSLRHHNDEFPVEKLFLRVPLDGRNALTALNTITSASRLRVLSIITCGIDPDHEYYAMDGLLSFSYEPDIGIIVSEWMIRAVNLIQLDSQSLFDRTMIYEENLKTAMVQAAQMLIDAIPSLKSGIFWEPSEPWSWNAWYWSLKDGIEPAIVTDSSPLSVCKSFALNRDGTDFRSL